jgi:hypothetical protein
MAKSYHQADHGLITNALKAISDFDPEQCETLEEAKAALRTAVDSATRARAEWDKMPFPRLHPQEPFFVFRGQDTLAPRAIHDYAARLETKGLDEQASDVEDVVQRFISWQIRMSDVVRLPT